MTNFHFEEAHVEDYHLRDIMLDYLKEKHVEVDADEEGALFLPVYIKGRGTGNLYVMDLASAVHDAIVRKYGIKL